LSAPELTARSVGRLYCEHSNMFKFVISSCLAAAALSQYVDPEKAKILKEQRFNAGDGRFGAAYAQEDGTVYREETSADGERVGQYSYIDQAGKTITVRYSAGKDGFKILEGDHVPTGANGQNSAPYVAPQTTRTQYQPQQQFSQQAAAPVQNTQNTFVPTQNYAPQPQQNVAPVNSNPFVNPHDPTHRNFQYNVNGGDINRNLNRNRNRNTPTFNPQPTQAPRQQFQQQFQPQQQQFQPQQQFTPTQAPRNFFPPGKLALNRFETGFNFDFTSE